MRQWRCQTRVPRMATGWMPIDVTMSLTAASAFNEARPADSHTGRALKEIKKRYQTRQKTIYETESDDHDVRGGFGPRHEHWRRFRANK